MATSRRSRRPDPGRRRADGKPTLTVPRIALDVLKVLDELVVPGLERLLPAVEALGAAGTSPRVLAGFRERDAAQDGLASLHHFLHEAMAEARRIKAAAE